MTTACTGLIETGEAVCPDGCCIEVADSSLRRRPAQDLYSRPMFEVLTDQPGGGLGSTMRIPVDEYNRPGRIFL